MLLQLRTHTLSQARAGNLTSSVCGATSVVRGARDTDVFRLCAPSSPFSPEVARSPLRPLANLSEDVAPSPADAFLVLGRDLADRAVDKGKLGHAGIFHQPVLDVRDRR